MEAPRSRAPWVGDPSAWGRIRLTKSMWMATIRAIDMYLQAMWKIHAGLPNPSPEGRRSILEIRELQKVLDNLHGLGEEKGWDLPALSTGSSPTGSADQPPSGT